MQFSSIVNRFIVKHNLILLLQTPFLEKKIFRKMFIVADFVSLIILSTDRIVSFHITIVECLSFVFDVLHARIQKTPPGGPDNILFLTLKAPPIICSRRQFPILPHFRKKQIRYDIS